MAISVGKKDVAELSVGSDTIQEVCVGNISVFQGANFFTAGQEIFVLLDNMIFNIKEE